MTPTLSLVKHDPPNSYGDCVRACVASILNMPAELVPHFYHDGCDGVEGTRRMRAYLATLGYGLNGVQYSGEALVTEVLEIMRENATDIYYILIAANASGDHAIVCKNDQIEFDPAWFVEPIIGPHSDGLWSVFMLVKL